MAILTSSLKQGSSFKQGNSLYIQKQAHTKIGDDGHAQIKQTVSVSVDLKQLKPPANKKYSKHELLNAFKALKNTGSSSEGIDLNTVAFEKVHVNRKGRVTFSGFIHSEHSEKTAENIAKSAITYSEKIDASSGKLLTSSVKIDLKVLLEAKEQRASVSKFVKDLKSAHPDLKSVIKYQELKKGLATFKKELGGNNIVRSEFVYITDLRSESSQKLSFDVREKGKKIVSHDPSLPTEYPVEKIGKKTPLGIKIHRANEKGFSRTTSEQRLIPSAPPTSMTKKTYELRNENPEFDRKNLVGLDLNIPGSPKAKLK